MSDQNQNRSTADWIVDLCVYAPIGFVLDASKYVPEFVDRGRNQVALARFLGKFAVDRLEKQLGPLGSLLRDPTAPDAPAPSNTAAPGPPNPAPVDDAVEAVAAEPAASAAVSTPPAPDHRTPDGASVPAPAKAPRTPRAKPTAGKPTAGTSTTGKSTTGKRNTGKPAASNGVAERAAAPRRRPKATPVVPSEPTESDLAISGYATLAASQIVPRLTTLARAELEAIGRFERANRARRTILNRVDQLLADR